MAERRYDVAVLGGGPGGYAAVLRAALRGARVCCIESGQLGGTCLNAGCIPTKAMLHASGLFADCGHAAPMGIDIDGARVNGTTFMARIADVTAGLRKGLGVLMNRRGVDVIAGRGRLAGPDRIEVAADGGTIEVAAGAIILATGSRPVRPRWLDWTCPHILTTDEATRLPSLPESILIVGGGIIGCEFATVYGELGVPTTVIELTDRLVPMLDETSARAVALSLKKRKVLIHTGAKVRRVIPTEDGVAVEIDPGQTLQAARVLVAVGREANIDQIGLEEVGVETAGGVIRVDDRCRTNVDGIYAVGDAAETRQYAHLAFRMGVVAADNATGHDAADDRTVVPIGVYTHPEVAAVGMSEQRAVQHCRESGEELKIGRFPYQASGLAQAQGRPVGEVRLFGDGRTGSLLGAVVIGYRATEVIQELALALRQGLTVADLAGTIHSHPTYVEAVGEAAETFLGLPLHWLG
ncbi:MAG TPA: dihydrolipoyl dehydrogenase [Phycisphaerae bacterium]|nr:dihydrolipoyl dehydrogenase [Phycisphaerae bacterium]